MDVPSGDRTWPAAEELAAPGLTLEPLSAEHTGEMARVLAPVELYAFTGGAPPTQGELERRYVRQSRGHSPDGTQGWLNWIVRDHATDQAVGYVQATLDIDDGAMAATVAWLVEPSFQGRGIASSATAAMLRWLRSQDVHDIRALITPGHEASEGVAPRVGMRPLERIEDGETVWVA
ncbi:GNAT family N-acetyltransferase [Demequina sp. NBRC 110056]|uniref:GNAT family N-acetyltransferase n=1 Tax=Demequina sp. NBRC 110056 TaxID=1570345 RepID=UPI0009FC3097|nr:GNAT family N-acetyltransferase [Demequina sp. NBRC 110056]